MKSQSTASAGKCTTMDHLPTKRKKERGDSHREPRRSKDTTEPDLHKIRIRLVSTKRSTPERSLTLQLNSVVRLKPMKLHITATKANSRDVRYTANDHFHGRLPVNTFHSKSRVVKNSHLRQVAINIMKKHVMHQDRSAHVDTAE
jgi:hypothetical protein